MAVNVSEDSVGVLAAAHGGDETILAADANTRYIVTGFFFRCAGGPTTILSLNSGASGGGDYRFVMNMADGESVNLESCRMVMDKGDAVVLGMTGGSGSCSGYLKYEEITSPA